MSSARLPRAALIAAALLAAPAARAGDPPVYELVDLGTLGGPASAALGLNEQRQVVGWATTSGACVIDDHLCRTAFLWEDGVMTPLPWLGGDEESVARAINDDGLIVGTSELDIVFGSGTFHGVTWTDGVVSPLPDFGNGSFPMDVNASGRIAGWASNLAQGGDRAVTWQGGVLSNEGAGESHASNRAQGLSDDGRLAGFAWNLFQPNDAIAQDGGAWKTVGGIDGPFQNAEAKDVNSSGVVVGLQAFPSGNWHPATWTLGKAGAVDCGLLPGTVLGELSDVNEAGVAVGRCYTDDVPQVSRAVLWDGAVLHDLNDLLAPGTSALMYDAQEINEAGDIAGAAIVGGELHAVLLTPVAARDPWTDLGHALAGAAGAPSLVGAGPLTAGSATSLTLAQALPGAPARLVFGLTELSAPFKGGVMVPDVNLLFGPFPVDGTGGLALAAPWPAGVPSGFTFFMQWWIEDAAGPAGFAASNGLSATTP